MLIKKKITSEDELSKSWKDDAVPFLEFIFNETRINECEYIDGEYYASYMAFVVTEPREMFWTIGSEAYSAIIQPGIYGLYKD